MAEVKGTKTATGTAEKTDRTGAKFDPATLKSKDISFTMQLGSKNANKRVCLVPLATTAPAPTAGIIRAAIDELSYATIREHKEVVAKNKNKDFGTLAPTDTVAYVAYFDLVNDDGEEDQGTLYIPYCPDLSKYAAMDAVMTTSAKDFYFGTGWNATFVRSAPATMKRAD